MIPPIVYLILSVLADFAVFFIVTISLNLEVGHTGVSQFGRVLAVQVGAFTVGGLTSRVLALILGFPAGVEYAIYKYNYAYVHEINGILAGNVALALGYFVLSLILAAMFGALIGWITSRPAIRLREAYLGISLLSYGEVFMWIAYNYEPLIGGSTAAHVPDPFRIILEKGGADGGFYRYAAMTFIMVGLAILVYIFVERLTKSPFGRTLKMHRDCELAASVYGIDIVKTRTRSLIIGAALAAIAGALYVIYVGVCNAIAFTRLTWTFWPWAYMMLGGIGSNPGILVGVLTFLTVRTLIVQYRFDVAAALRLPFDPIWLEYTLAGLAIILIVLFKPYGLIPEKPVTTLPRDKIEMMLKSVKEKREEK